MFFRSVEQKYEFPTNNYTTKLNKKNQDPNQNRKTKNRKTTSCFISHSQTTKNSLSELEKRERRAMERKLSELEEELKVITKVSFANRKR